jgi:nudix-type nucleoside diphosphatase (YffH/AdpP family)
MSLPIGNPRVRTVNVEVLCSDQYVLRKATYDFERHDGSWTRQSREVYDRGNGAVILLYDDSVGAVILIRQFRLPAYVNGHPDGMLIEVPAGLLDDDAPETAIRREVKEETGIDVEEVTPLWESFMSPGSVTERLHFFAARYEHTKSIGGMGGIVDEGEETEVMEVPLEIALAMVDDGRIVDAKTIMLLWWADRTGLCR